MSNAPFNIFIDQFKMIFIQEVTVVSWFAQTAFFQFSLSVYHLVMYHVVIIYSADSSVCASLWMGIVKTLYVGKHTRTTLH